MATIFTPGFCWFQQQASQVVAKQEAKYNTKGQEESTVLAMIRGFLKFMSLLGLVFAIIMYVLSCLCKSVWRWKDLIPVMQSLSWVVAFSLHESVIRGFFQGHNTWNLMLSVKLVEQVIRVIWMLWQPTSLWRLAQVITRKLWPSPLCSLIGMGASL